MGIDHRAALSESEPSTVRQKNWLAEPCVKFVFIDLSSHACMSTLAIAISVACGHSPLRSPVDVRACYLSRRYWNCSKSHRIRSCKQVVRGLIC